MATSTKDLLLGNNGASGSPTIPPIDSSLQGAPSTSGAAQQPIAAPSTPQPSSQQTVSPAAASTLTPPAKPDGNASTGMNPGQPIKSISQTAGEMLQVPRIGGGNAPQQPATPATSATPSTPASEEDDEIARYQKDIDEYKAKRDANLNDLMGYLDKEADRYKQPTEEELEKERKKRKRENIFNAISDGIQALSNLYFTTQYAPNSYNPKNSLSAKAQERYDKIDKERQDNGDKYYNILAKKYDLQAAADKQDLGWRQALDALRAKKAEAKAKAEAANAAAAAKQENADRDYNFKVQQAEAAAKRNAARDAEAARHNRAQEAIGRQNAASRAASSASGGGRGGSGRKTTLTIQTSDGTVHEYDNTRTGALTALAPRMRKAAQRAMASTTDPEEKRALRKLTQRLNEKANSRDMMAAIVAENAYMFPELDDDVRVAIGEKKNAFNVANHKRGGTSSGSSTSRSSTRPPLN